MAIGMTLMFVGLALGAAYGAYECRQRNRRDDALSRAAMALILAAAAGASFLWLPATAADPFRHRPALGFDPGWTCISPKGDFCVNMTTR